VSVSLVVVFAAVVLVVAPAAVREAQDFTDELPATIEDLYGWPLVGGWLEDNDAAGRVERWIDELPARIDDDTLAELGERALGGVFSAFVVVVTALGVLFDGRRMVTRLRVMVPSGERERADRVGHLIYDTFGSYFAGSLLVAVLNGLVILTVGLMLGIPLAPVAGLWATLTNLIPQVGGFLGGSFFVVLALTQGPVIGVIALVFFLAYQQLENNVIAPAVVGRAVNLSPPTTMLAALVGGAAAGVPGALIATPLIGAAKAVYLEQRGMLPPEKPATLRRRLQERAEKHALTARLADTIGLSEDDGATPDGESHSEGPAAVVSTPPSGDDGRP
jgi:putative heme transporter